MKEINRILPKEVQDFYLGYYSFEPNDNPDSSRIGNVTRNGKPVVEVHATTFYVIDDMCPIQSELLGFISLVRKHYAGYLYTRINTETIIGKI